MKPRIGRAPLRLVAFLALGTLLQLGAPPASAETVVWARQFGTGQFNLANGVAADSTGVYVAGESATPTGLNGFLVKYDLAGNRLWGSFHFGRPGHEQPLAVATGSSGVYTIVSISRDRPPYYFLLRRYHRFGTLAWSLRLGEINDSAPGANPPIVEPRAIAVDGSGVYFAGDVPLKPPGTHRTGLETFVAKFDPSGNELWHQRFGFDSAASAIGVGPLGVAVAGATGSGLGDNSTAGGSDSFVRLYTVDGQPIWTRQFGTAHDDGANGVAVDQTGVYVSGTSDGATRTSFVRNFDFAGQSIWHHRLPSSLSTHTAANGTPAGILVSGDAPTDGDSFVRGYGADGTVLFTTTIDASGPTHATGVAASPNGIFVAGGTQGAFLGQWRHADEDAFVARLG